MATSAFRLYNSAKKYLLGATLDLSSDTLRVGLVRAVTAKVSAYTISTWASAYLTAGNPCSGGGYAVRTLAGKTFTTGGSAKVARFDASDLVWTASGAAINSIKFLVIGVSGGKALGWVHLTDSAFALGTGNTITIQWHANGIFELTGGTT